MQRSRAHRSFATGVVLLLVFALACAVLPSSEPHSGRRCKRAEVSGVASVAHVTPRAPSDDQADPSRSAFFDVDATPPQWLETMADARGFAQWARRAERHNRHANGAFSGPAPPAMS